MYYSIRRRYLICFGVGFAVNNIPEKFVIAL